MRNNKITKEVMTEDVETLISIYEKYAKENQESKENLGKIKKSLKRFKNLSPDGQMKVMKGLIRNTSFVKANIETATCEEKGHKYTKWERLYWSETNLDYDEFVETYGKPLVYIRKCKVCGEQQVEELPKCKKDEQVRELRHKRILRLESELAELKKEESKNNKRRK